MSKINGSELCVFCRNLPFGNTGMSIQGVLDPAVYEQLCNAVGGEYRMNTAIYSVLHGAINDCRNRPLCATIVQGKC